MTDKSPRTGICHECPLLLEVPMPEVGKTSIGFTEDGRVFSKSNKGGRLVVGASSRSNEFYKRTHECKGPTKSFIDRVLAYTGVLHPSIARCDAAEKLDGQTFETEKLIEYTGS